MLIWSTIKNTFSNPTSLLVTSMRNLCTEDMLCIDKTALRRLMEDLEKPKLNIDKALTQFYKEIDTKPHKQGAQRLKFLIILFYCLSKPSIQVWLIHNKPNIEFKKQSMVQSSITLNLLEDYLSELYNRIYYYLMRKIKSGLGVDYIISEKSSPLEKGLFLSNHLYKIVNGMDFLFETTDVFHRLFSRYSGISLIQEAFEIVMQESNALYEVFKITYTSFLKNAANSAQTSQSQCQQVIETNKKTFRKLRQLYLLSQLFAGEGASMKNISIAKMAQLPAEFSKKLLENKRNIKQSNMSSSMVVLPTKTTAYSISNIYHEDVSECESDY